LKINYYKISNFMALNYSQITFLKQLDKNCIHGKNILAKNDKNNIENFYNEYNPFINSMNSSVIDKKIKAFIRYKNFVHTNNVNSNSKLIFSAQSKFESTILEEFLYHLFKEFVSDDVINVGSVKAYNNLYFSPKNFESFKTQNFIKINEKDQDFSIYKIIELKDNNNESYKLSVPVVSIECKTYIDKTMLEGSIATGEKIKSGNPHCKFYIVTETYEVDYKVDPSTSRIDNIFVLKKGGSANRDKQYFPDVIKSIYNTVKTYLESNWSDIKNNIENKGMIF